MVNKLERILTTLSLSASETREDTLKSIVKNTLFENNAPLTFQGLKESIDIIYDLEPHVSELQITLEKLVEEVEINYSKSSHSYSLSRDQLSQYSNADLEIKAKERVRFNNFRDFVNELADKDLELEDVKQLWKTFIEYLYGCFFRYGQSAVTMLMPLKDQSKKLEKKEFTGLIDEAQKKLARPELSNLFRNIVTTFSDNFLIEDIEFINDLAQKTLCFSSLGLQPELATELEAKNIVNWVLYLDTNVLFALLDLTDHPEKDACNSLVQLILSNPESINITFRYLEATLRELNYKRDELGDLDANLTPPAIRALIRSGRLDSFAHRYYEELLEDSDALHPSLVLEHADKSLAGKSIQISRNKKQLDSLNQEFIDTRIGELLAFIDRQNENKLFFAKEKGIKEPRLTYKSDAQARHDVFLRQAILGMRATLKNGEVQSLNQSKYFSLTLDSVLMKFDKYDLTQKGGTQYPTFFRPSFLLNQLIKILPVKTDDYKRAFIKAVSSRSFNKKVSGGTEILKIAKHFKKMGIDNENAILNIASEDLFLEEFKTKSAEPGFVPEVFFESEINKLLSQKESHLKTLENEKSDVEKRAQNEEITRVKFELENNLLVKTTAADKEDIKNLRKALKQLGAKTSKLTKSIESTTDPAALKLDFEGAEKDKKIEALSSELRDKNRDELAAFRKNKLRKWRIRSVIIASVFLFLLAIITITVYYAFDQDLDALDREIRNVEKNHFLSIIAKVIYAIAAVASYFFVGKPIYDTFKNPSAIKAYLDNLDLADHLKGLD